ncbi:Do family serine endopeptidase [Notoacmeibacter ruber]|uniref:Probable periplasmic serine endoprotease DegP-like n=1 Tax=Notoacmeibacter ruber TaxID=2670375 RepID=A0A3L7J9V9_9HYPH|nr:Do family serine endopeptidase [Notoacmeibacter ruber]RLQ87538.1 Do family serine endopeptidase [Notoacmeibacter ruber]
MAQKPSTPLRRRLLAAAGAVAILGGGAAGISTYQSMPAFADQVTVPTTERSTAFDGFADVVERVSPAVVSVRVKSNRQLTSNNQNGFSFEFRGMPGLEQLPEDHPFRRFFREFGGQDDDARPNRERDRAERDRPRRERPSGQGSGFFISEDGYVVTNNHVVENGSSYTVVLDDGTELDGKLVGTDPRTDLAVLKVDTEGRDIQFVKFADDSKVRVGDWVLAIGNPFGLGGSVTAGIVSARGRDIGAGPYDDFIQIDAPVNRGNSGGPAFNTAGEVIGINTAIFSPSGGNVGIAFAIPATAASRIVDDLIDDGSIERGWLGVQIAPVSDDIAEAVGLDMAEGALVQQPTEKSPGAQAGIEAGDIIVAVNGEKIDDPRSLSRKIAGFEPDTEITVSVFRDGDTKDIDVQLGLMPKPDEMAMSSGPAQEDSQAPEQASSSLDDLGLTVTPAEDGEGLVITEVEADSDAEDKGLSAGDIILKVNGQAVNSAEDVTDATDKALEGGRRAVLMQVKTNDAQRFVALPVSRG